MDYALGVIGAGNMAEAIVRGVAKAGGFLPIAVSDPSAARRELFQRELGAAAFDDNAAVAASSRMLLLSVKPQHMAAALDSIRAVLRPQTLVISIAAGISTGYIDRMLGGGRRIIRAMPNTPMLLDEGAAAICRGGHATDEDAAAARRLFESAASVIEVREDQMDAVTAVSGSGPAYFFFLVEQMIRAGVELGLSADDARLLASKTALGAARMLIESSDSPQELRRKVTSPGGTTHAAISYLESQNWPAATVAALKAAAARSKELGK